LEIRGTSNRHGANHRHGDSNSFIIDSESNIDDQKNNTTQPLPHVSRNRNAIQGPEPLEKWQKPSRHFVTFRRSDSLTTSSVLFSKDSLPTRQCRWKYPHSFSVVQTTKTYSPRNLHRRRSGHVCTAAATRIQAQTEYGMHNGRKWTKADMLSTRYLTPYIA